MASGYHQDESTVRAPPGTSSPACPGCHLQALLLDRAVHWFSPLAAATAPSDTMIASPQEETYRSVLGGFLQLLCQRYVAPSAVRSHHRVP